MNYINLSDSIERRLSFYLAMEEYVARHIPQDDCFTIWQVPSTVIYGRHQQLESEVNVDYCRQHNIQVYKRKSGGGCVYADRNNLMLSLITADEHVGLAFNRFVSFLLLALHRMGIEATGTSHNDILIGNRKVSGTACYHLPQRCIVHSTLLYDTNMEHMLHAITPGPEKLQSKGIKSVRQRITLLKDHTHLTLDEVKTTLRETFCPPTSSTTLQLSATDIERIQEIEKQYL